MCNHGGSPLPEAGSSLPFPLRRDEFVLTRRHGAGVRARGPTYVFAEQATSSYDKSQSPMRRTDQPQPGLGKAIRELREKRGATLKEIAPKAGITFGTLALIERGEGNPTWATVRGIAGALGVSAAELAKAAEGLEDERH